ncbi:MAG: RluA family pseudouridine synthase [Sphingobacteriaceae bacterium]|nr:RluA family pseudouridine synthase [Sphingobacteriaceae bacterium]
MKSPELQLTIPAQQPHLGRFLAGRLSGVNQQQLDTLFYQGRVLLNGETVPAEVPVQAGDQVRILQRDRRILPEKLSVEVVYEDADCLVVNKPADMAVHPGLGTYGGTLLNWLAWYAAESAGADAAASWLPQAVVHRLDKATSGLLVLAKNKVANQQLQQQMAAGSTERKYVARVWGCPTPENGSIDLPMGRDPAQPQLLRVDDTGSFGKAALTHYQLLEKQGDTSLLALFPQTGRTHQLRIHLHHIGHGIVGDLRYVQAVQPASFVPARLSLHAASIGFVHPTQGHKCHFESDLPSDL